MTTTQLHVYDIVECYTDSRWGGHGYLRSRATIGGFQNADKFLLNWAAAHSWDNEKLFQFCNSTDGRKYGDATLGDEWDAEDSEVRAMFPLVNFERWYLEGEK